MDSAPNEAFFDTLPVFEEFEGVADADNYRPLPDDWVLACRRHRQLDQGDRQRPLQGRQHGGRQRDLGDPQQRRAPRPALRVRRRRRVRGGSRLGGRADAGTRWRRSRPGSPRNCSSSCAPRSCRSPTSAHKASTCASPASRQARKSPTRCSPAAAPAGPRRQMKAGRYAIGAAPAGTRPDLTGLSCRWNPIEAHHGEIVSIIAVPGDAGSRRRVPGARLRCRGAGRRARSAAAIRCLSTGPDFGFPPKGHGL